MTLDEMLQMIEELDPVDLAKKLGSPTELDDVLRCLAFELRSAQGQLAQVQTEADMWLEQLLIERAEALHPVLDLMDAEDADRAAEVEALHDELSLKSACIRGMDQRMAEWHTRVEELTAENAKLKAEVVGLWEDAAGGGCDEGL
jgi:uncharacterized small protein (DUF1192 family)